MTPRESGTVGESLVSAAEPEDKPKVFPEIRSVGSSRVVVWQPLKGPV